MTQSPADLTIPAERSPAQRSRMTNGSALLPGVDGRSAWVRRCRDLIDLHLADMGGADRCSEAEHSIVRRIAVLTTELERLEARMAGSAVPDGAVLDLYQRTSGNLRRLLEAIGLERRSRDLTPDLARYIAGKTSDAPRATPGPPPPLPPYEEPT